MQVFYGLVWCCAAVIGEPEFKFETVQEIQGRVNSVLETAGSLTFQAEIERWIKDHEMIKYLADVRMDTSGVETKVFNLATSPPRPLVVVKNGETVRLDDGKEKIEGCLYGSLEVSWIGPVNSNSPSFRKRIGSGTIAGTEIVDGLTCLKIVNERQLSFGTQKYRRLEIYCIDPETHLVRQWVSEEYDLPQNKLVMRTSRRYSAMVVEPAESHKQTESGVDR